MSIPKHSEIYKSFLGVLVDCKEHTFKDIEKQVIIDFNLSDEDVVKLLPSGKQTILRNRIGWCMTYLKKAGLIESLSKAHYKITDDGKKIYNTTDNIDNDTLKMFPSFNEFFNQSSCNDNNDVILNKEKTSKEILDNVYEELNKVLCDDLLNRICKKSPKFFEKLVINLMEKMGYGSGKVTKFSKDEGIDGIVYQDKLGFGVIYIQAKCYNLDSKIGRPALQQFNGAISNKDGKGMFVTTASFSKEAIKYAESQHIILIDGYRLAQLMIEYDYGVSTEYVYKIKKIDANIFEDE